MSHSESSDSFLDFFALLVDFSEAIWPDLTPRVAREAILTEKSEKMKFLTIFRWKKVTLTSIDFRRMGRRGVEFHCLLCADWSNEYFLCFEAR